MSVRASSISARPQPTPAPEAGRASNSSALPNVEFAGSVPEPGPTSDVEVVVADPWIPRTWKQVGLAAFWVVLFGAFFLLCWGGV